MGKEQTENERKYLIRADDLGESSLTQTPNSSFMNNRHYSSGQAAKKPNPKAISHSWLGKNGSSGLITYYSPRDPGDLFPGIKPAVFDLPRHVPFQELKRSRP